MWFFLCHPSWWLRPIVISFISGVVLILIAGAVGWWQWPTAELQGWSWWWQAGIAVGISGASLVAGWCVALPIIIALAMEDLSRKTLQQAGSSVIDATIWHGLWSSVRVLINTLPMRLGWLGLSVGLAIVAGPVGAVIGFISIGQMASLDALDCALALRGCDGRTRLQLLHEHRSERFSAGIVAGLLQMLCMSTIVLIPLWLPGIVVGAARRVAIWKIPEKSLL